MLEIERIAREIGFIAGFAQALPNSTEGRASGL